MNRDEQEKNGSTKELDMEYNSQRPELIIPEYGRNVQKLINYAKTVDNPKYRQALAERIIDLMHQMNPQNRNMDDYREKLWKHLFRIADYEIDVVPPSGDIPKPEDIYKQPEAIPYPQTVAEFKHYGNNVHRLIKKAMSMPPGTKRDGFVRVIGAYMKLAYKTWNKEHFVSDETIKADLLALSNGRLKLDDETAINNLSTPSRRRKRSGSQNGGSNGGGKGHQRGKNRNRRKG